MKLGLGLGLKAIAILAVVLTVGFLAYDYISLRVLNKGLKTTAKQGESLTNQDAKSRKIVKAERKKRSVALKKAGTQKDIDQPLADSVREYWNNSR